MLFDLKNLSGDSSQFIIIALANILAVVLALSLHEFAHAFTAYKCGDSTPKLTGRLTLNPLNHMDPIGLVCCAIFRFGWAKPVQINPTNFRNIKKGVILTSIAGVLTNLIFAFISFGLYKLCLLIISTNVLVLFLQYFLYYLFMINLCLAVFNFLPIYPLDGFKLVEVLSKYNNNFVKFMYRYGNLILILLIVFFDSLLIRLISLISYPITWFWSLIF